MRPRRALRGLALAAVLLPGSARAARTVDLLYIEPNTGTSSGGHLALRFDDRVYHFQNTPGDWLRMARVDADWFRYVYSVLQNRGIRLGRVALEDAAFAALLDRFNERYLIGRKHFAVRDGLRRDRELLERMARAQGAREVREPPAEPLPLRGAGFFDPRGGDEAPVLARLRTAVQRAQGPSFLAEAGASLRASLRALRPPAPRSSDLEVEAGGYPTTGALFSDRFADLALAWQALATLERAPPLRAEALRALPGAGAVLDDAERRSLAAFASRLEQRLAELPLSRRPDWGYPMLLGMARLVAIDATLRSGRWHVLDAFPADSLELSGASVRTRRDYLGEIETEAARGLQAARTALAARALPSERSYNDVEDRANRWLELSRGLAQERDLRLSGERLVPEGRGPVWDAALPTGRGLDLAALLDGARARERAYDHALERVYGYDLFRRNCVSEIFRTLDAALGPEASRALLGGRVDPDAGLHFVPLVAYEAAVQRYRGVGEAEIPSYRHTRLEQMYAAENDLAVYLRESNTLTSSIYRPTPQDSWFLFFTDDAVWPRPLFGAANVVAGAGELAWGLLQLPFDGGRRLWSGAQGVLFSLPELFFVNLRKGTLEYGPGATPRTRATDPHAR